MAEVQGSRFRDLDSYQFSFVKKVQQIFYNPLEALFRKGSLTVLKRVKFFATCLVSAQSLGFMNYIKEIFLILQFLNPQIRNSGLSGFAL